MSRESGGRGWFSSAAKPGFPVRVSLAKSDPLMRPGLSVRVEVVRATWAKALSVPRGAVRFEKDGPVAKRRGGDDDEGEARGLHAARVRGGVGPRGGRPCLAILSSPGACGARRSASGSSPASWRRHSCCWPCARRGPTWGRPIEVKRADLVLSVDVEGELAAVRSTEIGVPPVAEVDFKIAFLAPEGQQVKQGESVLRLDTEMLERQLAEKRAELAGGAEEGRAEADRARHEAARPGAAGGSGARRPGPRPAQGRRPGRGPAAPRAREGSPRQARPRARPAEPRRRGPGDAGAHGGRAVVAAPAARPRGGPGGGARGGDRQDEHPRAAGRASWSTARTGATRRRRWATRCGSARWCSPSPTSPR